MKIDSSTEQQKEQDFAVTASDLVKKYKNAANPALNNFNLYIKKGEFFGLLGANGAGKTTAVSIFSCLFLSTLCFSCLFCNFSQPEWRKYMGEQRPFEKTCPDLPQDTLGAIELVQEALELRQAGKEKQARTKFAQAKELDANIGF